MCELRSANQKQDTSFAQSVDTLLEIGGAGYESGRADTDKMTDVKTVGLIAICFSLLHGKDERLFTILLFSKIKKGR